MAIPLKLTIYKDSQLVGEESFNRDIIKIGRLASAHLRLDDDKVSRIHAVIQALGDGSGYDLIDMGSTEGTRLNGEKVSKKRLGDGDELELGKSRIVISFDNASDIQSAAAAMSTPPAAPSPTGPLWVPSADEMSGAPVTQMTAAYSPHAASGDLLGSGDVLASSPSQDLGAYQQQAYQQPNYQQPGYQQAGFQQPGYAQAGYAQPGYEAHTTSGLPAPAVQPRGLTPTPTPLAQQGAQVYGQPGSVLPYPIPSGVPHSSTDVALHGGGYPMAAYNQDPWGSVPNNLASEGVPDSQRELEVKVLWGTTVVDSIAAFDQPLVTMGDERKVQGWGPFQKIETADVEVPSKGLPDQTWNFARSDGKGACNYTLNLPPQWDGRIERADGTVIPKAALAQGGYGAHAGDQPGALLYHLKPEETVYLWWNHLLLQVRYVRKSTLVPPPFMETLNYTWVNILVLAFFFHLLAVATFLATPITSADLVEDLYKNPSRFAQFRLTPEQKKKGQSNLLEQLKAAAGAKAADKSGKSGKKDSKKKKGRMAVKGDPSKKELAKSTLDKLFGGSAGARGALFGSGGLGGELEGALGNVTGTKVGDAQGLGGLGTRGSGPGGGGLSMNSVGLGALGTRGRGGGGDGSGYGSGAAGMGNKVDRDINISAGSPVIMGSLDKELIRRVIQQHIAQIRYCYEKELTRSPGLFGKVATQFTISAAGTVQTAKIAQSTLKNGEVERCITAKIRTWKFPKPKGGGIVIVKYPFIFKTSG